MQIVQKAIGQFELKFRDTTVNLGSKIVLGGYELPGPGEYEVGGVMAEGSDQVVRLEAEDMHIGFLNRGIQKLSDHELEHLGAVDIFFFPLGGEGGLPLKEAQTLLTQVEAPLMIPMAASTSDLEAFTTAQTGVERQSGALKLTRSQLPSEGSKVLVFE